MMKKLCSIVTLLAATSLFAAGDIYEIRPCNAAGTTVTPSWSLTNPMGSGQTFYFNVRLKTRAYPTSAEKYSFKFGYTGYGSETNDWVSHPPALALFASNQHDSDGNRTPVFAKLVNGPTPMAESGDGACFWDCVFEYTTKAGDFALPASLAVNDGGIIKPVLDNEKASTYYLDPTAPWQLYYVTTTYDTDGNVTSVTQKTAEWSIGNMSITPAPAKPASDSPVKDYTLGLCKFYIQTATFDSAWASEDYWRTVTVNEVEKGTTKGTITIDATAAGAAQATTLYVWSDDDSVVTIKGGKEVETVTNYVEGVAQYGTIRVGTLTFAAGAATADFTIQGVDSNKTANIVLSAWDHYNFDGDNAKMTDYATAPVYCGYAPPPSPTVYVSSSEESPASTAARSLAMATSVKSPAELNEDAQPIYVMLSQAYDQPLTVQLAVKYAADETVDPFAENLLAIETSGGEDGTFSTADVAVTNVTFAAGETKATLWAYPLGSDTNTVRGAKGILVSAVIPDETAAKVYTVKRDLTVYIGSMTATDRQPVIASPADGFAYTSVPGTTSGGFDIDLLAYGCYRDMNLTNGFTVTLSGAIELTTNLVFDVYHIKPTTIHVTDYDKKVTGAQSFTITVAEPAAVYGSDARSVSSTCTFTVNVVEDKTIAVTDWYDADGLVAATPYYEGDALTPQFTLTGGTSTKDLYVFLVPQDEATSNYVSSQIFTHGMPLRAGTKATDSTLNTFALTFLDGCAQTDGTDGLLNFGVVVSTDQNDPTKVDTTFAPVPATFSLSIKNAKPSIQSVKINGSPESVTNDANAIWKNVLSAQVYIPFEAKLSDPSWDFDVSNGLVTVWCFSDGQTSSQYKYEFNRITNATDLVTINHRFSYAGGATQDVKVVVIDKDMLASIPGYTATSTPKTSAEISRLWTTVTDPTKAYYSAPYQFKVAVGSKPRINLWFADTGTDRETILENIKTGGMRISLSEAVEEDLELAVTVTPDSSEQNGTLSFATTKLTIWSSNTEPDNDNKYSTEYGGLKYVYSALDGTDTSLNSGFTVTVEVTSPSEGYESWASEAHIYVQNTSPVIYPVEPEVLGTNKSVAVGESFAISWRVTDVTADLAAGLTARWYIDGSIRNELTTTVYDTDWHETSGIVIKSSGAHEIMLDIRDKDYTGEDSGDGLDGRSTRRWLYYIQPTKKLIVSPFGPVTGTESKYGAAAGVGNGRVYNDNASVWDVKSFIHTYTYSVGAATGELYAYGYVNAADGSYPDDGKLFGVGDYALDPNGNLWTSGNYYTYTETFDSYFYRWYVHKLASTGSSSSETSTSEDSDTYGNISMTPRKNDQSLLLYQVALDAYDEQKTDYATRQAEAIFSRELYESDNMGDINADGVPDWYVGVYKFDVFDDDGEETGNDLASLRTYNEDGDYLPNSDTAILASFIPGLSNTWATAGLPFTAVMEIRGRGGEGDGGLSNLNKPLKGNYPSTIQNLIKWPTVRYTDPAEDDASTLSALEYWAFTEWCARQEPALDPTDEANWSKWSPECPTDPTLADTDGDGMPDGYEYYFWYKAHVGGTNYKRLTGRRYVPEAPNEPATITADQIESLFNPNTYNGNFAAADTDNDGISDLAELALGTNPVDFDTDRDGLPDGYEVAVSGTDPVAGFKDGVANPDGDAMAYYTYGTTVVAVRDASGKGAYLIAAEGQTFSTEVDENVTNLVYDAETKFYTAWLYNDGVYCRGRAADHTAYTVAGLAFPATAAIIHSEVYQQFPYDPRTGWNRCSHAGHVVNSQAFTTRDEFLVQAFYYHAGALALDAITPSTLAEHAQFWKEQSPDPNSADSDGDNMPDGWELYVQAGPGAAAESPYADHSPVIADKSVDTDQDGLTWAREYSGVESCAQYSGISNPNPRWQNKWWPTDPWNADTDGDGILDGNEWNGEKWDGILRNFNYGTAVHNRGDYEDTVPGGGLNPLSWDTDCDGLPDPWELEFAGTTSASVEENDTDESDGTNSVDTTSIVWKTDGGMDGTVKDASKDYDCDGLQNWQEYMVGAMRCWRYDDTVAPWAEPALDAKKLAKYTDEQWTDLLLNPASTNYNPRLCTSQVDPGIYFSCATNAFEQQWLVNHIAHNMFYMFRDGVYHHLKNSGNVTIGEGLVVITYPSSYISCNPKEYDTDHDGMDDYYELFHGLNPLLGVSGAVPTHTYDNEPCDIVCRAYSGALTAEFNYWIANSNVLHRTRTDVALRLKDASKSTYDFFQFPWLTGLVTADPDGDNIRNQQEAILANVQAAATYLHTDPSPLWMTDSSYSNSFTHLYYQMNGETLLGAAIVPPSVLAQCPWLTVGYNSLGGFKEWGSFSEMFDFEENEGYDSDHDFLSDFEEGQGKTQTASDPQYHDDPLHRQAMWFGGANDPGFLETQTPVGEVSPETGTSTTIGQKFLYYTVECWAHPDVESLTADGQIRTLVERVCYTGSANAADEKFLRRNFLIGIKNGRWYTRFDSTGTDENQPVEIVNGTTATTNWTHVAASYDGTALKLYVNGACCVSKATSIQPEHGIAAITVSRASEQDATMLLWSPKMVAILVGASAKTRNGIVYDYSFESEGTDNTTIADYTCFYKGYIDEVRIWDGARSAADIGSDYSSRTRYNTTLAEDNRNLVYTSWRNGATRSPSSSATLPAQLMYHWGFDNIAGASETNWVVTVPAGFGTADTVTDAKPRWCRPVGWTCPWLDSIDSTIASKVYTDHSWIPWINDTVGHLPVYDKTTEDSVFWSADYSGTNSASVYGYTSFGFPRTAEVPSRRHQVFANPTRWNFVSGASNELLVAAFQFARLNRYLQGYDLLPFGSAYPKRISASEGGMWDDQGSADAWLMTGEDKYNVGLPNWWTAHVVATPGTYGLPEGVTSADDITWDTVIWYNGVKMSAGNAYQTDLKKGMLPDGVYHNEVNTSDNFADADRLDTDGDGLPDWWEKMWRLSPTVDDADDDPDYDGLSNYQEYMLSQVYFDTFGDEFASVGVTNVSLNPLQAYSTDGQKVSDYFLAYAPGSEVEIKTDDASHFFLGEYFGEIVADHDFMEDWWENAYGTDYTSARRYDPLQDADEDGWSTWAECRSSLWGSTFTASLIDKWTGYNSDQYVVCRPQPIVGVKLTYHGVQDISGQQLVVRTKTGQRSRVDATFVVPSSLDGQTKYIGGFAADTTLHGHLSPGMINVNSVVFSCAEVSSDKTYIWNCSWYKTNDPNSIGWDNTSWSSCSTTHAGTFAEFTTEYASWPHIELSGGDFTWESFVSTVPSADLSSATLMIDGVTTFGTLDCTTGEYELDMSKFKASKGSFDDYVFHVTYTAHLGHEWPQTVYLSDTKELDTTGTVGIGDGYVREGRNTIEAFMDLNANGTFDVGEPFGSARNVMVGWHKVPVVTIELHDDSPVMPCVAIDTTSNGNSQGSDDSNVVTSAASSLQKKIQVTRRLINGRNANNGVYLTERSLVTKNVVLDDHAYITEADVVNVAKPDLDWAWLNHDAAKFGVDEISSVTYSVDEVQTLADGTTTNVTLSTFTKTFPSVRATATPVAPIEQAPVYASAPTFKFTSSDAVSTGYRLQIRNAATQMLVYDSGAQLLPGRTSGTVGQYLYAVTPPIFADMDVFAGETTGTVFADGSNYQWRVALMSAKYDTAEDADYSSWTDFQLDVANQNRYPLQATGYGTVELAVRYYGIATNVAPSDIIVEAFENADFCGQPLAQVRLSGDAATLRSQKDVQKVNATLSGVKPGKRFFRAYYDQNRNGIRDRWESWGYLNEISSGLTAIYNPQELTVVTSDSAWQASEKSEYVIYVEDCDVNQNEWPDCRDEASDWLAASKADTPYWIEPESTSSNPLVDTDGDGMPDDWETWNDGITDPIVKDGDTLPEGSMDAMAYLEETWQMVTLDDGSEDGVRYLLGGDQKYDSRDGLVASNYTFTTWYLYGPSTSAGQIYGVGTNVVINTAWNIKSASSVTVALVHGQVYARQGYNALTANATALLADTAVDTKAFTALDRYLVMRYFEAIGVTPKDYPSKYASFEEYALNAGEEVWKNWTLMPGTVDANNDFVADGWQLYVMYGDNLKVGSQMAAGDRGVSNPWGSIAATTKAAPDGDGLSWRQEYNLGDYPSNPWSKYSLYDEETGITDAIAHKYQMETTDRQLDDVDNDGLSNWAEYLAALKTGYDFQVDEAYSVEEDVLDYFVKLDDGQYVGEAADVDGLGLIADHDFMEDAWEDEWDPTDTDPESLYANRYVYDANVDSDEDGWKNWSECRAYFWACGFYSDIIDTFINGNDDAELRCFPQPAIGLKVTYNGSLDSSWKSLIVRTYTKNSNYPDAIFDVNSMRSDNGDATTDATDNESSGQQNNQILGVYNGMPMMHGYVNPGLIVPSSAKFEMTPVNQELTYHWNCTECGLAGGDWTIVTDTNGVVVAERSGSYTEYKSDITLHGDRDSSQDNRGVHLEKTTPASGWTTFATSGGATDGRHGTIYYAPDGDITVKEVEIGTIDYRTGAFEMNMGVLVDKYNMSFKGMAFQVVNTYTLGAYWPQTVWLSNPKKGYVKEGANTIEAFLDLNGDSKYDVGEPYGRLDNVDIGWQKTSEMRIELRDGTYNGVPLFEIESSSDEYDSEQSTSEQDEGVTDGKVQVATLNVDSAKTDGGETGLAPYTLTPDGDYTSFLRIVRTAINGKQLDAKRVVFAKRVNVAYGKVYTVADFIAKGRVDLDAKHLVKDAAAAGIAQKDIRSAKYAVCWGAGTTNELFTFTRAFDLAAYAPSIDAACTNAYYRLLKAQPELSWVGREGYGAFAVQVSDSADFGTVLYAATNMLPAASTQDLVYNAGAKDGEKFTAYTYTVKPDLYVGEKLENGKTYYWRVAQLNAKFTTNVWSDVATFTTAINSDNANTGYGKIAAEIRYYGADTAALSDVVVGVYESGDFCSAPVARKHLTGDAAIDTLVNNGDFLDVDENVTFDGVTPGDYYVMAYVDKNHNGVRDAYETWGYACKIGTEETDLWTPVATNVVSTKTATPRMLVVMEDTDVNQNNTPDALEDMTDWIAGTEADDDDADVDSDEDGITDSEEEAAGLDPYDPSDADDFNADDVMAYVEFTSRVVTLSDGVSTIQVVLPATDVEPVYTGSSLTGRKVYTAYVYRTTADGTVYGVTSLEPATLSDGSLVVTKVEEGATVALVHGQVHEYYGFDATTANPEAGDAVNTKEMTAYDKTRGLKNYLAAIGETPKMLDPSKVDYDGDTIPDGWELYVGSDPWSAADAATDADGDGVTLANEYDGGHPTDPSNKDTDGDGITDNYYHEYLGWDPTGDYDGDGLSNYSEYLITEVFKLQKCDPKQYATSDSTCDYFKKMGQLYYGEIFTDHDQVNDLWEQKYIDAANDGAAYANSAVFDPERDADNDGWSNYAEAKAGTNPEVKSSQGVDGVEFAEHPVPTIKATVTYNGQLNAIRSQVIFKAWNESRDADMVKAPDAIWTVAAPSSSSSDTTTTTTDTTTTSTDSTKYIGKNPGGVASYCLGASSIKNGSLKVYFRDLRCRKATLVNGIETKSVVATDVSEWYYLIEDVDGVLQTAVSTNSVVANTEEPVTVGKVDYATGIVTIDFSKLPETSYQSLANGDGTRDTDAQSQSFSYQAVKLDIANSYVRIDWTATSTGTSIDRTYYLGAADEPETTDGLTTSLGYVREGATKFIAFADLDASGDYTAGEPFGFVQGVDVGWQGAAFTVNLSDTSPIFARINLRTGANDRSYFQQMASTIGTNLTAHASSDDITGTDGGYVRVRVVRTAINGTHMSAMLNPQNEDEHATETVVMDKNFNTKIRPYLHEGDFLDATHFDIDSGSLMSDAVEYKAWSWPVDATSVTYRVVFGDGEIVDDPTNAPTFMYSVDRRFDTAYNTVSAVIRSEDASVTAYNTRPTFKWAITDGKWNYNSYTAFKLQVYASNGSTALYDSGLQPMPGYETVDGIYYYVWTAPSIVGNMLTKNGTIDLNGKYKWKVSVYNAKYTGGKSSSWGTLTTDVNVTGDIGDHTYSTIPVTVKYAGPEAVLANADDTCSSLLGKVRVQAFETADFSGEPVSESLVTSEIADASVTTANGKLYGLPANGTYYLRAYIDSNGNLEKDDWESWGAAKTVVAAGISTPVGIWIEDADTDDDWLPDAYEYAICSSKGSDGWLTKQGKTVSGEFVVNSNLYDSVMAKTLTANIANNMAGTTLTAFTYDEVAMLICGSTDYSFATVDDIRNAVRKTVQKDTVKVTSLTLDSTGKKVVIGVGAEVADSIAGKTLSKLYAFDTSVTVTVNVYKKTTLAEDWSKTPCSKTVTINANLDTLVDVALDPSVDLTSGFFKVEVVQ